MICRNLLRKNTNLYNFDLEKRKELLKNEDDIFLINLKEYKSIEEQIKSVKSKNKIVLMVGYIENNKNKNLIEAEEKTIIIKIDEDNYIWVDLDYKSLTCFDIKNKKDYNMGMDPFYNPFIKYISQENFNNIILEYIKEKYKELLDKHNKNNRFSYSDVRKKLVDFVVDEI